MNQTFSQQQSYTFDNIKTYLAAVIFIIGNVLLPQLCHLIPNGGFIFLPIYFFTLVGALVFGWRVGLLTALSSPLVNFLLFGMPPVAMLPVIEVKSVLLACIAGIAVMKFKKVNLLLIALVVILSQIAGGLFEWCWTSNIMSAVQDFRIGVPGILLQIFGGYAAVKLIAEHK